MKSVGQGAHLTFKANRTRGRHGWLRLTPAYSAHLAGELLDSRDSPQRVLDPFCGTGTTPLLCAERGIEARAVDINPFLVWFATLKCTTFTTAQVQSFEDASRAVARATAADVGLDRWTPPIHDILKWWARDTLTVLSRTWASIDSGTTARKPGVRDLLCVAFCRTLIDCANVSFGHQSMSFRSKTDAGPELFPETAEMRVLGAFARACGDLAVSLREPLPSTVDTRIVLGDSRDLGSALPGEGFSTVITSPPYPNRMSYIRELRPYMYWLGYLQEAREAGELDWKAIGGTWGCATSNLTSWAPRGDVLVPHAEFSSILEQISEHSPLLATYVHKYFEDAVLHIRCLVPLLARGARIHYVVGNSKFFGVMLPTEGLYADIFRAAGLCDVGIRTIRKRTSKKELFEFVVSATAG